MKPLFGYNLDTRSLEEIVKILPSLLSTPKLNVITTLNPEIIVNAEHHPELKTFIQTTLCVPDGTGLILAARWIHNTKLSKVPGIELANRILDEGCHGI